jgi:hypothetical protein
MTEQVSFASIQTIMTMLHDRNYLVSQRELEMTMKQFTEQFGDNPEYVLLANACSAPAKIVSSDEILPSVFRLSPLPSPQPE